MQKQIAALRKGVLELNVLACQEPAAMRREARLVLQSLSLVMLSLLEEATNEVERRQEQLLTLGVILPEDAGTTWMQACLQNTVESLRDKYRKIQKMRRKKGGPSSIH